VEQRQPAVEDVVRAYLQAAHVQVGHVHHELVGQDDALRRTGRAGREQDHRVLVPLAGVDARRGVLASLLQHAVQRHHVKTRDGAARLRVDEHDR